VIGRRRAAAVAAAAGLTLVGAIAAWRTRDRPEPAARGAITARGEARPVPWPAPVATTPPSDAAVSDVASGGGLTPTGTARALQAIGKNEHTRLLFARLLPLGLSREQRDRLVLILGTAALRPTAESPTLKALRASGRTGPVSDEEGKRVLEERRRIAERALQDLRPALAAVLTPAQLAQAGLAADPGPPEDRHGFVKSRDAR
jgi:hypothetical protein